MELLVSGLGSIGMRHARNFRGLGVQNIVGFDPSEERRARFVSEVGGVAVANLADGLKRKPDLAVIACPNAFHLAQALEAAKAGIHLFIEKPLSHMRDGVDDLERVVSDKRLYAHVGSNFKFHPAFVTMKRLIDAQALGRVTGAQVLAGQWLPDWHPWEDFRQMYSARSALGGGILLDAHEFDYLLWLLGPVTAISGMSTRSGALDIETEDVASVCLRFARGTLATVQLDYIQRETRRRYHLSGDAGTLEWDIRTPYVSHFRADTKSTEMIDAPMPDLNEMYVAQSRHVLAGVKGEVAPVTPISAATQALDIVMAVKNVRH